MTERSIDNDTIVAVATAPGRAGIGVVRVSGSLAVSIAEALTGITPRPRSARLASFCDAAGNQVDQGLMLYFRGPNSFTGEDVVEFQGHGSDVALALVVERVLDCGARLARPGEFAERSFVNGKIDLVQAEAIVDLVNGATRQAILGANRSLSGVFSDRVRAVDGGLITLRMHVEGGIDFSDEDVDFLAEFGVETEIERLVGEIEDLLARARVGIKLNDGLQLALLGATNVGKSSLLNRLADVDRAIVTDIPGTTRDTLDVQFEIGGLPVCLVDTAGVRETTDQVEQAGLQRTRDAVAAADVVLWVVDDAEREDDDLFSQLSIDRSASQVLRVENKCDLTDRTFGFDSKNTTARVSALTGQGFDSLRDAIRGLAGVQTGEGMFTARQRHIDALRRALNALQASAQIAAESGAAMPELIAEELGRAHSALGEIVGDVSADDLLGVIFSNFCIGK